MASPAKYSPFRQMERQYDPILQVYREPSLEARAKQLEATRQQQQLAHSQARFHRNEQFFDLLSNTQKQSPQQPLRKTGLQPSASYDIIANAGSPESHTSHPSPMLSSPVQRPFDIISGQYYRDHDQKVRSEFLQSKLEAVQKYWQTHEYEPIVGRYVDQDREQCVRAAERERREKDLQRQKAQLPLSYQIHDMYYRNPAVNLDTVPLPDAQRKRYEVKYFLEKEAQRRNEVTEQKHLLGLGVASIEKITGGTRRNTNPFLTAERSPNTSMYTGKVWERLQNESQHAGKVSWH